MEMYISKAIMSKIDCHVRNEHQKKEGVPYHHYVKRYSKQAQPKVKSHMGESQTTSPLARPPSLTGVVVLEVLMIK